MEPTHDVPQGGAPLNTPASPFTQRSMRPVIPTVDRVRSFNDHLQKKPEPKPANPFAAVQEANRSNEDLVIRLQNLVEKLAGDTPTFEPGKEPEDTGGLMPLAARVANLITERSKHGVTLIDKLEEYLQ